MLERVLVVGDVVVVVVGIGKERVTGGKDIAGGEVWRWQEGLGRILDDKELLGVVAQVLAKLVAQVGVGVAVAHYLYRTGASDAAVVGGDDDLIVGLRHAAEEVGNDGVTEPGEGDAAVGRLVVGQLAHHARLCTGVGEHVDEIEHDDVEVVTAQRVELLHQLVGLGRVVYLVIREGVTAAVAVYLGADKGLFVEILTFLLVLVDPQVGKHLGYLVGHKAGEDGVARVLRGGGKDAEVEVLVDVEEVAYLLRQQTPLVVAEIVEHHEQHLLTLVEHREHFGLEELVGHEGHVLRRGESGLRRTGYPPEIVSFHKLGKAHVGLFLLHGEHLGHLRVGAGELQLPVHQLPVHLHPVLVCAAVGYLHAYLLEMLLVAALRHLGLYLAAVYVLFQHKEYLVGVHGLDEIVGYLLSDGLLHDVLLLALSNHHHWGGGLKVLYALKRLKTAQTWHLLVEEHQVETAVSAHVNGIAAIAHSGHSVAFLLQKDDVGLEQLHLIVYPQ